MKWFSNNNSKNTNNSIIIKKNIWRNLDNLPRKDSYGFHEIETGAHKKLKGWNDNRDAERTGRQYCQKIPEIKGYHRA